MKTRSTIAIAAAAAVAGFAAGQIPAAHAQLDKILKGGAIIAIVDNTGKDIDKFVNKVVNNDPDDARFTTKVVPILTVGSGGFAGAAQVSGPRSIVDEVRAVAQIEANTRLGARLKVRGLIPIADRNITDPTKLKRVTGVGLTATIEVKL